MYKLRDGNGVRFAELMDRVSLIAPEVRFRFTSPHPKDFPDPLLKLIAERPNLCK
jgi:tRNA A37 methylthiotransferase MiaB